MARVRNRYPRTLENWYARRLKKLVRQWNQQASFYLQKYVNPNISGGISLVNDDSDIDQIIRGLELMTAMMKNNVNDHEFEILAQKYVNALNNYSYNSILSKTKIRGIDPISDNKTLKAMVQLNIKNNVSLIDKMYSTYYNSIQTDVYNSITKGTSIGEMSKVLAKRMNITLSHAELISNDQTGTIISQFDSYRAKHAGAERYIWHSMEDNRVRPKHRELDGKTFKYDDPNGGDSGQLPGEPIRCRCFAEPIF